MYGAPGQNVPARHEIDFPIRVSVLTWGKPQTDQNMDSLVFAAGGEFYMKELKSS